jgi:hypothetical protein
MQDNYSDNFAGETEEDHENHDSTLAFPEFEAKVLTIQPQIRSI